ncbi:MAG: acyl carrier protein [Rhodocyclaceae bacterium]|nr:acyl carrier protein [Rhodocyclaceae bacterium]
MDALTLIRDFVCSHSEIDREKVVPEAVLAEVGIDSLMLLEVMFEYEEKTGVKLPEDLPTPVTVQDLIDQLDRLAPGSAS